MRRLRKELGPIRADLFAYPFSADGSWQTNDPRIPAFLDQALHARFSEVFNDGHPRHPPRTAQRTLTRKEVNTVTTAAALYAWLAIDPRTPAQVKAQAAAHAALVARAAPSPKAAARHHAKARRTTSHTKARHTKARRAAIHRRRTKHDSR